MPSRVQRNAARPCVSAAGPVVERSKRTVKRGEMNGKLSWMEHVIPGDRMTSPGRALSRKDLTQAVLGDKVGG